MITSHGLEIGPGLAIGPSLAAARGIGAQGVPPAYRARRTRRLGGDFISARKSGRLLWASGTLVLVAALGFGLATGRQTVIQTFPAARQIYAFLGLADGPSAASNRHETPVPIDPGCGGPHPTGHPDVTNRQDPGCGAGSAGVAPK